jgi:predicted metal-dependent HD superfamily phosphohydrolase
MDSLERWWGDTWVSLGRVPPDGLLPELLRRYAEPHRAYHNATHLVECFARFDEASALAEHRGEVLFAIWFHDAVYDPRASDNEERSARWGREIIGSTGGASDEAGRVAQLILSTRHDSLPAPGDSALVVDIDLAILGAGPIRFAEYESQIRQEYDWVPPAIFRHRRAEILRSFLRRPRIYATAPFFARYESPARENLTRAVSVLAGADETDKADEPDKTDKADRADKTDRADRADRADKDGTPT